MKFLLLVVSLISMVAAQDVFDPHVDVAVEAYRWWSLLRRLRDQGNFAERDAGFNVMTGVIQNNCDKHGPAGAFENLKMETVNFTTCIDEAKAPNAANDTIRETVRYVCRLAPQIGKCLGDWSEAAKPCLPPIRRESFLLANLTHSFINYACGNDAERLYAFVVGGGLQCLFNREEEVKQCTDRYDPKDLLSTAETSTESGEEESNCKKSAELESCLEEKLASCPSLAAVIAYKGLAYIMHEYSPCHRLHQPEGTMFSELTI